MKKLKILFLAANPEGTQILSLDKEARDIEAKLRASEYRDVFELKTKWATTADDLIQALNEEQPTIVHFSGHGSKTKGLILHNEKSGAAYVTPDALVKLFKALKENIKIVILNACYTQEQAKSISTVIDCVIGINNSIYDESAIKFAASFYRAIGFAKSVQNAFEQGKAAIALAGGIDDNEPIIHSKTGIDANQIYLAGEPKIQLLTTTDTTSASPLELINEKNTKEIDIDIEKFLSKSYRIIEKYTTEGSVDVESYGIELLSLIISPEAIFRFKVKKCLEEIIYSFHHFVNINSEQLKEITESTIGKSLIGYLVSLDKKHKSRETETYKIYSEIGISSVSNSYLETEIYEFINEIITEMSNKVDADRSKHHQLKEGEIEYEKLDDIINDAKLKVKNKIIYEIKTQVEKKPNILPQSVDDSKTYKEKMAKAEDIISRYRNTLRVLAK